MTSIIEWIEGTIGIGLEAQTRILASIAAIFLLWLIRRIVLMIINRRQDDITIRYRWRKSTAYVAFGFGVVVVGSIWFEGFQSVSTYLGLLSAGLAIALRDPLVNLAGWAFILWRRPFVVGDRIQIDDQRGDVIDQRIFMFSLMEIGNWVDADQSTGRVIHIPNGKIFIGVLANYTSGFQYIWDEIPVLLTFESNWKQAKSILTGIASKNAEHLSEAAASEIRKAAQKLMIFYSHLTPIVYTSVQDSGVLLTIRYLTAPRSRRSSVEAMWEDILDAFSECDDIDFAYPTQRFYHNRLEGKPGAGGEG
jgi:small-conductance mechanosensitive channel